MIKRIKIKDELPKLNDVIIVIVERLTYKNSRYDIGSYHKLDNGEYFISTDRSLYFKKNNFLCTNRYGEKEQILQFAYINNPKETK